VTGNGRPYGSAAGGQSDKRAMNRRRTGEPSAADMTGALACGRRCPCAAAGRRGYGKVHCPAHDDRRPSLVVHEREGRALFHCKAGCTQAAVVAALRDRGLWGARDSTRTREGARIRPARQTDGPHRPSDEIAADRVGWDAPAERTTRPGNGGRPGREAPRTEYRYIAETGELLAVHVRLDLRDGSKRMWWEGADRRPSQGRIKPERLPLYRLPDLLISDPETPVLLVEGEQCADAAAGVGAVAVSLAGGASQRDFGTALAALRGRRVVLWPDCDTPGRALMHAVARALDGIAADVRWVEPLSFLDSSDNLLDKGYDVADYLRDGHNGDDLRRVIERAGPVPPPDPGPPSMAVARLPPAPLFPLHVLPPVARRLVEEGAAALDCPPELVAVPLLAFTGGCLGARFEIVLKPGWTQRAIVWCAVVAEPGSAKSPAQSLAQRPLSVLQREARERHLQQLREYEQALAAWTAKARDSERGEKPERPEMEHYFTTDSTPEGIARMLGHPQSCTAGLVVVRDELVAFVRSFDAYKAGRGGERQTWLSLWAGVEFKIDRAGRDPYFVVSPTISLVGGVQPDALASLQAEAGQRDGFIERFLFSYPDTRPMRWTDATVAQDTIDAVTAVFRRLRQRGAAGVVRLRPDALAAFRGWVDDNAAAQERVSGLLRGVYSKLPNQAARLALILHTLAHPDGPAEHRVSADTMNGTLELVEYFRAHAARALTHFGEAAQVAGPLAMRVLRVLRSEDRWVSRGELRERLGGHTPSVEITAALTELAASGLAETREVASGEKGGRPREEWRAVQRRREETVKTAQTAGGEEVSTVFADTAHDGDAGEAFEL
jgi:hypothetical protein